MASAKYFKQQLFKKYNLGNPIDQGLVNNVNKYGIGESDEQITRDMERIFTFLTTNKDINDKIINKAEIENKEFNKVVPTSRIGKVGEHNLSYWEQEKERKLKAKERSRQGYNRKRENMLERAMRRFAEKQGVRPIEPIPKSMNFKKDKRDENRFKRVPLTLKSK